jgi:hypothetical protein
VTDIHPKPLIVGLQLSTSAKEHSVKHLRLLGLGVACVAALTACGGSSGSKAVSPGSPAAKSQATNGEETKSPEQVFSDAKIAFGSATAVHITGNLTDSGSSAQTDGQLQQQAGQVTENASFGTVHIIDTGGKVYLQGPPAYWVKTGAAKYATQLGNKWIVAPPAVANALATQLTVQGFASRLSATDSAFQPGVAKAEVAGQPAVVVTQTDGSQLFVSDTGNPVPLRLVNKGQGDADLTFSDYGKLTPIDPPPNPVTPQQAAAGGATGTA